MKYYTFHRENDDFNDILKDSVIKPVLGTKLRWTEYLFIGINDENEGVLSYIALKYGDDLASSTHQDFTPIPGVDYIPKKDKTQFTKD